MTLDKGVSHWETLVSYANDRNKSFIGEFDLRLELFQKERAVRVPGIVS